MGNGVVQVPRGLLISLVCILMVSLMGVAFLLGRQTSPPSVATGPPPPQLVREVVDAQPPPPEVTVTATVPVEGSPAAAPGPSKPVVAPHATVTLLPPVRTGTPAEVSLASATPSVSPTPAAPHPAHAPPGSPAGKAVAAYFQAVDAIAPGELAEDPDKFANEVVQGAMNGDTSSLDKLIKETEASREKLTSLNPPAPCATYHAESLALTDESLHILKVLGKALKSSDATALTSVAGQAQAMQSKAKSLKEREAALKSQFGLR